MVEIISYKMCAVKVRNAKLRNYLKRVVRFSNPISRSKTAKWYKKATKYCFLAGLLTLYVT
jgi:N-acetylmuramic acid 6-phosphate (MurNAc-6-P) etherase